MNQMSGKRSWVLVLGLGLVALVGVWGCGKGDGSASPASAEAAVGLYQSTSPELKSHNADYFFITANKDIYLLQKDQTTYTRNYQGNLSNVSFTIAGGQFSSGNAQGTKLQGNEASLPEAIQRLHAINESARKLLPILNAQGFNLEVRLERKSPAFEAKQKEIIDTLVAQSDTLLAYLRDHKLKGVWILDLVNPNLYTQLGWLCLPAGLTAKDGNEVLGILKTGSPIDPY